MPTKKRKVSRRTKIRKSYVTRDSKGRIKKWTSIKRSQAADRSRKSRTKPKRKGRGNRGDYK